MSHDIPALAKAELEQSREPLNRQYFHELLNFVGNHEGKLFMAAILASQPTRWFSLGDLLDEVKTRQDGQDGWVPNHKTLIDYCRANFLEMGLVEGTTSLGKNRRLVQEFRCFTSEADRLLAFCGAGLEWSKNYQGQSVQQYYGRTRSEGKYRSPQIRHEIYLSSFNSTGVISGPDVAVALQKSGIDHPIRIEKQLRVLAGRGVLDQTTGPNYAINQAHYESLFDLCITMEDFRLEPSSTTLQRQALDIINNPESAALVMKKAEIFSTQT